MEILLKGFNEVIHSPYVHVFSILMIFDIFTGYIKAFKIKKWDSHTGTMGLLKHATVLCSILFIGTYARALGYSTISIGWCSFFIFNYLGSLLENWEAINIAFPEWLKPYINQMKKQNNNRVVGTLKIEDIEVGKEVPLKKEK